MIPPAPTPAPKVKTLEEQKTDFTSEGSPPPGVVGAHVPAAADETTLGVPRATIHVPDARKHSPSDKGPDAK